MEPTATEEAVQQIAARLANTGQVLSAWSRMLGEGQTEQRRRLTSAVHQLERAVRALRAGREEELSEPGGVVTVGEAGVGLRGRSEMISLVEMVAFLSSLGKDGILQANTDVEDYVLELSQGSLTYVTLRGPQDVPELGDVLVDEGFLTRLDLEASVSSSKPGEFLGESLLRQELLTLDERRSGLTKHALLIFTRMHRVGTGFRFQFEENAQILERKDLTLNVSGLLLESARLVDEEEKNPKHSVTQGLGELAAELEAVPAPLPGEDAPSAAPETGPLATGDADEARFREALVERLEADALDLPMLPDSTGHLLSLLWADDFATDEVMTCVRRDQALCAYVLRMANSASFAPAATITDVQLAVTRLGLAKLREIAMALTLKQRVFQVEGWEDFVRKLWRRAALTSGFGCVVGKACGSGSVRGGMVGLLIDVGMPMVLHALQEIAREESLTLTIPVAERLMDEFHARAGELLAERWSLPDWVAAGIAHHHRYQDTVTFRYDAMVGNFAHRLALWAESPETIEAETLPALPVFRDLGLQPRVLRDLLSNRASILELARVFA